jgi:uncharacterized membrane protein
VFQDVSRGRHTAAMLQRERRVSNRSHWGSSIDLGTLSSPLRTPSRVDVASALSPNHLSSAGSCVYSTSTQPQYVTIASVFALVYVGRVADI